MKLLLFLSLSFISMLNAITEDYLLLRWNFNNNNYVVTIPYKNLSLVGHFAIIPTNHNPARCYAPYNCTFKTQTFCNGYFIAHTNDNHYSLVTNLSDENKVILNGKVFKASKEYIQIER